MSRRTPRPVREAIIGRLDTLSDRFWAKVPYRDVAPGACWLWAGARNGGKGYGQIDKVLAHRVSYFLATGDDPGDRDVLHSCDNPPCVRPSHLSLGTHADNMADAAKKGRMPGRPTLTEDQVAEAKRLYAAGMPAAVIADRLGASQQHISRLVVDVPTEWKRTGWKRSPRMKLTDEQVQEIRTRYAAGGVTQRALAAEYGIDQGYLCALVKRRDRKDVA